VKRTGKRLLRNLIDWEGQWLYQKQKRKGKLREACAPECPAEKNRSKKEHYDQILVPCHLDRKDLDMLMKEGSEGNVVKGQEMEQ
jgi:hypothetical protein